MRFVLITMNLACLGLVLSGCSKSPEAPPPASYPPPIEIIEDAATAPEPAVSQVAARASQEFECVSGASQELGLVEAEPPSTRDDGGGHVVSVLSYNGEGLSVFGLPAQYVQRLSEPTGWSGVGAYVKADEASVSRLVQARFANVRAENGYLVGEGMANPIVLQQTTGDLLYIQCAPAR